MEKKLWVTKKPGLFPKTILLLQSLFSTLVAAPTPLFCSALFVVPKATPKKPVQRAAQGQCNLGKKHGHNAAVQLHSPARSHCNLMSNVTSESIHWRSLTGWDLTSIFVEILLFVKLKNMYVLLFMHRFDHVCARAGVCVCVYFCNLGGIT